MAKLVYIATFGPDDPTKACLPFHLAVNGAVPSGIDAEIGLAGDATELIRDPIINGLVPLGLPPFKELVQSVIQRGVPIYVCEGCARARGISDTDLRGKNATFISAPDLARHCAEATNVITV
ncbi:MAG TPA: DsrE family protein [Nitrolancea sp.]|nr:DsrE family protein [Nitrolancea sp.]